MHAKQPTSSARLLARFRSIHGCDDHLVADKNRTEGVTEPTAVRWPTRAAALVFLMGDSVDTVGSASDNYTGCLSGCCPGNGLDGRASSYARRVIPARARSRGAAAEEPGPGVRCCATFMADCVHSLRAAHPALPGALDDSEQQLPADALSLRLRGNRERPDIRLRFVLREFVSRAERLKRDRPEDAAPASLTARSTTQPSAKPNPRSVSAYPLPSGSSPSARYAATRSSPTATYSSGRGSRIITGAGYPQVAGSAPGVRCRRGGNVDEPARLTVLATAARAVTATAPSTWPGRAWSGGSPAGALPVRQDLTTPEGSPTCRTNWRALGS